jgi:hypothetical protein
VPATICILGGGIWFMETLKYRILSTQYLAYSDIGIVIKDGKRGVFYARRDNIAKIVFEKQKDTFADIFMFIAHGPFGMIMNRFLLGYNLYISKNNGDTFKLDMKDLKVNRKVLENLRGFCGESGISCTMK